jgi:hypothetical protein
MEDYFETQRQKSEEKLAGELTKFITIILLDWAKQSHDPEFKKFALGISDYTGRHLWHVHGHNVKEHLIDLYDNLIHEIHGTLQHDYENHIIKRAENAANDIWVSYYNH